ncbi:hypothetical protein [Streptomyces sp. NPDC049040]|uniref:hypothetical protein n=1 Tax=Streptomyces sp. NPDC049040 TaxID=3365593 RepID=UPI003717C354
MSGHADVDQEELDALTAQLRRRLLDLDVDGVRLDRSAAEVPEGAKPGEAIAVGALAVSLAPAVFRSALLLVETWMQNRPVRAVKVDIAGRSIELGQASAEQQQLLVEAFLAELRGTPGTAGPSGTEQAPGASGEPPAAQG